VRLPALVRSLSAVLCLPLLTSVAGCSPTTPATPLTSASRSSSEPNAGFLNQWRAGRDAGDLARTWYVTPQGSHLLDFDVFMSIPSASDQATLFADRANLESYGFLYWDGYESNGLPIGMVKDTRGDGHTPLAKHAQDLTRDFVGFTCAACHTGDVRYNGERFFVHAGQSNLDYERFIADLGSAVTRTAADPKGNGFFSRMADRGADEKAAASRLAAAQQRMDGLRERGQIALGREAGPGRIDAIGHILNEVFGHHYNDSISIKPVQVPVSVPAVWNAARLQCVQTNCLTSNSLTRNVGEVLGVFGDSETYTDSSGRWRVRSTAKVKNLYELEEALDWIESPKWSAKFPPPAGDLATGAKAFATHCQRCHAQPYLDRFNAQWQATGENWHGSNDASGLKEHFVAEDYLDQTRYVWRVTRVGLATVGTDDQFIKAHGQARYTRNARATEILDGKMRDGILATLRERVGGLGSLIAGRLAELEGRDVTYTGQAIVDREFTKLRNAQLTSANPLRKADGSVMTLILLAGSTASAVDSYFLDTYTDRETAARERDRFAFYRARPQPPTLAQMAVYRARPLNGVAFTAPYGHSGVWPTIESVLFPELRPASFWLGHAEFDPAAVGVDVKKGEAICGGADRRPTCFKIETTEHRPGMDDSGNSRSGHEGASFYRGMEPSATEKRAIIEYVKSI
jgi:mono/diheme cytochrome c family protein